MFYRMLLNYFKSPQYLILFVNRNCWCRCVHCWYNEKWKIDHLQKDDLTFDELEKIAASVDGLIFLSLTGGEAFERKDIVEIAGMFASTTKMKRYQIPTSGFDTDMVVSKTEQLIAKNKNIPFRVDVSLDGVEENHDRIRGRNGCYFNAIKTINELIRIKKRIPYFDVGIITTISAANHNDINEISKTVERINPSGEWMVNVVRGEPRDPAVLDVKIDSYKLAHDLIEDRIKRNKYSGHGGHRFAKWLSAKNATRRKMILAILQGRSRKSRCAAGILGGVIYNDGSVYPCEMTNESFGNIRNYECNLKKIWNSSSAENTRKMIRLKQCICTQECFLSINLATQPKYWPDIISERIKLFLYS